MVLVFVPLLLNLAVLSIKGASDFRILRMEKCEFSDPGKGNISCTNDGVEPRALNISVNFYQPCDKASVSTHIY